MSKAIFSRFKFYFFAGVFVLGLVSQAHAADVLSDVIGTWTFQKTIGGAAEPAFTFIFNEDLTVTKANSTPGEFGVFSVSENTLTLTFGDDQQTATYSGTVVNTSGKIGIGDGEVSIAVNGNPSASGTFTATKGKDVKPAKPKPNAKVDGTWLISLNPAYDGVAVLTWDFDKADKSGYGAIFDTTGEQIGYYQVTESQIALSNDVLYLTGAIVKTTISGDFDDNGDVMGTWRAVKTAAPKFGSKETLAAGVKVVKMDSQSVATLPLQGKYSITASVPVSPDVIAALNGDSPFSLHFGQFSETFPLSLSDYKAGATKVKYTKINVNNSAANIAFALDWSGKNTLKIKITGGLSGKLAPAITAEGVSPQATAYLVATSQKISDLQAPCTILFGTSETDLAITSAGSVKYVPLTNVNGKVKFSSKVLLAGGITKR